MSEERAGNAYVSGYRTLEGDMIRACWSFLT